MYQYKATITNVVDGDTVDATVDLGFHMQAKLRFRLSGVDTPELRSSNEDERNRAKLAKQYVIDKCLDKEVVIESHKTGKFGRWIGDVIIDGQSLSTLLIESGHGVEYR